jgi:pilus assembly protein CpaC
VTEAHSVIAMRNQTTGRPRAFLAGHPKILVLLASLVLCAGSTLEAQVGVSDNVVTVPRGHSFLVTQPGPVQRVSIGDPEIADAIVVSPDEVLVNGLALGSTTLIIWDQANVRQTYTVEVTIDVGALQRTVQRLYPGENVRVSASGSVVILSGSVSEAAMARRIRELAEASGAIVVNNLVQPGPRQIMLQVRIAEVSRNVLREFNSRLISLNPDQLGGQGDWTAETVSDGLLRLLLVDPSASVEALFRALRTTGEVRTLAEPNLIAVEGSSASFLAGGEFPFPVVQQASTASGNAALAIEWREFGVRLDFTPTVTETGNIRLRVHPEVSSLDFSTGLTVGGVAVPALLTRRAETEVELGDGQTFAIAGLLDNNTLDSVTRIPLLGDLPVIGALFRSRARRQNRTELLVLVTPRLVTPLNVAPPVPPGEPETWPFDSHIRQRPGVPGAVVPQ